MTSPPGTLVDMPPAEWQGLDRHFRYFQLLYVALKAKIPVSLADGPMPLTDLAALLKLEPMRLRRIMRGLVWCGAADADEQERYFLTTAGRSLLDESQGGFADAIRWQGEFFFRAWGHLDDYLFKGEIPFVQAYNGTALFDRLSTSPALSDQFTAPMTAHSARYSAAVSAHPALEAVQTIVDVGGGEGQLLADILQNRPQARGIVFDLPSLEPGATVLLARAGIADRCRFLGGNMFDAVPPNADLYLLKWVLHDWDDDKAARILNWCAASMTIHSRLLIVERLMPRNVNASNAALVQADLNMLCQNGGAERTLDEYEQLLTHAGLQLHTMTPIDNTFGFFILEAVRSHGHERPAE